MGHLLFHGVFEPAFRPLVQGGRETGFRGRNPVTDFRQTDIGLPGGCGG